MHVYIITLFLITFICLYSYSHSQKKLCCILCAIILTFVSGFRYFVGTDYGTYCLLYINDYSKNYNPLQFALYFVAHIAKLIYDDYSTWFFLMAAITMSFVVSGIYKHSTSAYLSLVFLVILGFWSTSFNAVKQCAAVAILFCFQEFIYEKKFLKWLIVCLIASLFHVSALFCIPIYFISYIKNTRKYIAVLVVAGVIISFEADFFIQLMVGMLGRKFYYQDVFSRHVNIIRVIVQVIPSILYLFLGVKASKNDNKLLLLGKMSLLNSMIYISGMNSVYMLRMGIYTEIYNILLLPVLFKNFKGRFGKILIIFTTYVLYLTFWLVDLSKTTDTSVFSWVFNRT